jgi:aspartate-semialdehyde dehydrogenase
MPKLDRDSRKIVIAGASSLLGAELRSLLEESRFAGEEFQLVDEEIAAGTLTGVAGEPRVILPVEEDSFKGARTVFFTGSAEFTRRNAPVAQRAGAQIVDLSGGLASERGAVAWFPKLDWLASRKFPKDYRIFLIPSAAATAAAGLALALAKIGLERLAVVCFQSASEAGRAGVEELESQTGQLLSFQGVGQPVFDTQVAFNMLDRYGPASLQKLHSVRERVQVETKLCLGTLAPPPAVQVLHAPVFYGSSFVAVASLDRGAVAQKIMRACEDGGFALMPEDGAGPSNVGAAGEKSIQLAAPVADSSAEGTWWFWGAADNIRLPAANAVKLAEMLT